MSCTAKVPVCPLVPYIPKEDVYCRLSEWGNFSSCSTRCGAGTKTRERKYLHPEYKEACEANPDKAATVENVECYGSDDNCVQDPAVISESNQFCSNLTFACRGGTWNVITGSGRNAMPPAVRDTKRGIWYPKGILKSVQLKRWSNATNRLAQKRRAKMQRPAQRLVFKIVMRRDFITVSSKNLPISSRVLSRIPESNLVRDSC